MTDRIGRAKTRIEAAAMRTAEIERGPMMGEVEPAYISKYLVKEECELVAVHTGEGWALYVEKDDEVVAMLKWPEVFGEYQTGEELRQKGFRVE